VNEAFKTPFKHMSDIDFQLDIRPINCGFGSLEKNDILRDFQPDLVIIAARPGHCKTAMGLNLALNIAKHGSSQIYSLEMTSTQMARRTITLDSGIPMHKLKLLSQDTLSRYREKIRDYDLKVDDTNGLDINTLCARSFDYARITRPTVTVVDYLQIVSSSKRERRDSVAEVTKGLKSLAKRLGSPIIALAQLNREYEKRLAENPEARPMMGDIADCADIERYADSIIILHKAYPDLVKAFCVKNRHGAEFDFQMRFNADIGRLEDLGVTKPEDKGL